MEGLVINEAVVIVNKDKVKNKIVTSVFKGKIVAKLFEIKIEQSSINRKAKTGISKHTKKSFIYTSKEHQQWEQMNLPLIHNEMIKKGLTVNDTDKFALLLLTHPHYNQDGNTVGGVIKDAGNMLKNLPDMLEGVVYENDKQVMLAVGMYSSMITPHELGYRYRTDGKSKKEVQKETEIKYLTLKVYRVE